MELWTQLVPWCLVPKGGGGFGTSLWKMGEFFLEMWVNFWVVGSLTFFESEYWIIDQWLVIRMHTTRWQYVGTIIFQVCTYIHPMYTRVCTSWRTTTWSLGWQIWIVIQASYDSFSGKPSERPPKNSSWMTGKGDSCFLLTPSNFNVDLQDCWSSHNSSRSRCLLLWLWWALYQTSRHHSQVAQSVGCQV